MGRGSTYFIGMACEEPLLARGRIHGYHQGVTWIYNGGPVLSKQGLQMGDKDRSSLSGDERRG